MADSTAVDGAVDTRPLRYRIAQAIHDSDHARAQYAAERIDWHSWEDCAFQDAYLLDADAALSVFEPEWQEGLQSDAEYEYTVIAECDGSGVQHYRRTPRRVAAIPFGPWEPATAEAVAAARYYPSGAGSDDTDKETTNG